MSIIQAPTKYVHLTGNADLAYDAICKTLSERAAQVDWEAFDQNDWQLFAQIADTEGVAPLLHWQVRTGVITDEWPTEVCQYLQTSYYKSTAHNALLFQELDRVLTAFESAQIPIIVLKGAALAQTIYPEPGLRPMNDIDIAVNPEDLGDSLKILKHLGYSRWKMTYHALLVSKTGIFLELHWCFLSSGKEAIHPEMLFKSKDDAYLVNVQAHFLHLCVHLFYQHFGENRRLLWGYDLFALATNREIDWVMLEKMAGKLNWSEAFYFSMAWVQESFRLILFIELPHMFREGNSDLSKSGIEDIKHWIRQAYFMLPMGQKFTWLQSILIPNAEYFNLVYHPKRQWLWPFYLLHRWKDFRRS